MAIAAGGKKIVFSGKTATATDKEGKTQTFVKSKSGGYTSVTPTVDAGKESLATATQVVQEATKQLIDKQRAEEAGKQSLVTATQAVQEATKQLIEKQRAKEQQQKQQVISQVFTQQTYIQPQTKAEYGYSGTQPTQSRTVELQTPTYNIIREDFNQKVLQQTAQDISKQQQEQNVQRTATSTPAQLKAQEEIKSQAITGRTITIINNPLKETPAGQVNLNPVRFIGAPVAFGVETIQTGGGNIAKGVQEIYGSVQKEGIVSTGGKAIVGTIKRTATDPFAVAGETYTGSIIGKVVTAKIRPAKITESPATIETIVLEDGRIATKSISQANVESGLIFRTGEKYTIESIGKFEKRPEAIMPKETELELPKIRDDSFKPELITEYKPTPVKETGTQLSTEVKPQIKEGKKGRQQIPETNLENINKEIYTGTIENFVKDASGKVVKTEKLPAELQIVNGEQTLYVAGKPYKITQEVVATPKGVATYRNLVQREGYYGLDIERQSVKTLTEDLATGKKTISYTQQTLDIKEPSFKFTEPKYNLRRIGFEEKKLLTDKPTSWKVKAKFDTTDFNNEPIFGRYTPSQNIIELNKNLQFDKLEAQKTYFHEAIHETDFFKNKQLENAPDDFWKDYNLVLEKEISKIYKDYDKLPGSYKYDYMEMRARVGELYIEKPEILKQKTPKLYEEYKQFFEKNIDKDFFENIDKKIKYDKSLSKYVIEPEIKGRTTKINLDLQPKVQRFEGISERYIEPKLEVQTNRLKQVEGKFSEKDLEIKGKLEYKELPKQIDIREGQIKTEFEYKTRSQATRNKLESPQVREERAISEVFGRDFVRMQKETKFIDLGDIKPSRSSQIFEDPQIKIEPQVKKSQLDMKKPTEPSFKGKGAQEMQFEESKLTQKPKSISNTKTIDISGLDRIKIPIKGKSFIPSMGFATTPSLKISPMQDISQIKGIAQERVQEKTPTQEQPQDQTPIQERPQDQIITPIQDIIQEKETDRPIPPIQITTNIMQPPGIIISPPPIIPTVKPILFTFNNKQVPADKLAYDVYVRQKGKEVKINKQPLGFNEAIKKSKEIDNTVEASTEIRPKGYNTRGDIPSQDYGDKFRLRKTKNALLFVEKSKYRIDSQGEKQGLSLAKQQKGLNKLNLRL